MITIKSKSKKTTLMAVVRTKPEKGTKGMLEFSPVFCYRVKKKEIEIPE